MAHHAGMGVRTGRSMRVMARRRRSAAWAPATGCSSWTRTTPRSSACSTGVPRSGRSSTACPTRSASTSPGSASSTPTGDIVLGHAVRVRTDVVDGLVVPPGVGLGGRVMQTGRPAVGGRLPGRRRPRPPVQRPGRAGGRQGDDRGAARARRPPARGALRRQPGRDPLRRPRRPALETAAARAANAAVVAERARHSAEVAVHEERRRLALQLHDTVGAMLFTIGAGVHSSATSSPGTRTCGPSSRPSSARPPRRPPCSASRSRRCTPRPRRWRSAVALRADCRSFEERTGIPTRLLVLDDLPPLHGSRSAALAAAVREALLNVEKHAQAGSGAGERVHSPRRRHGRRPRRRRRAARRLGGPTGLGPRRRHRSPRPGRRRLTMGRNDDGGVTVQAWVPA